MAIWSRFAPCSLGSACCRQRDLQLRKGFSARAIIVLPFALGGATRIAAEASPSNGRTLGQKIVIDNRAAPAARWHPGGGRAIPTVHLQLVIRHPGRLSPPLQEPRLRSANGADPYDRRTPHLIVAHPGFPADNNELIKNRQGDRRARPYDSPERGTLNHLGPGAMAYRASMKLSHVAYKGAGGAARRSARRPPSASISATPSARPVLADTVTHSR